MTDRRDRVTRGVGAVRTWATPRLRLVGSAAAVGFLVGGLFTVALSLRFPRTVATTLTFSVGTLVLGFGILGWSGSIFAGPGIETMGRLLDAKSRWTETDSRRAMARVTGFGLGITLAVPAAATVLSSVGVT